ncbi:MAG: PaaX family transcriptional regulator C-terminal domain-containing protein [Ardenticatenaceae bacterium]
MIRFLDYSTKIEYNQIMRINTDDKFNNRFGVMIILGDFILPNQRTFWLDGLLVKLSWLDVLERTGRSTLSRMTKDGWFDVEKLGRRNRYRLTKWGETVLRQGDLRIFEQAVQEWDGKWHLLTYSLPEEKRVLRHNLVKQLSWLGYGRISRGTWLSPYDRRDPLRQALKEPDTNKFLHFFSGSYLGNTNIDQLIQDCWDLETVSGEYKRFIRYYEQVLADLRAKTNGLTAEEAFRQRFWVSYDFLPLLRLDPNLPKRFLPTPWAGFEARQLYTTFKEQVPIPPDLFSK